MKKTKIAKALLPFMLLGSPVMANGGGSSVRSGSRFRVKKAVVQSSVKADTQEIEIKEFKSPFGVFGSSKTSIKKTKDSQSDIVVFLEKNNLLSYTKENKNKILGDINQLGLNRKDFAGYTISSGKCYKTPYSTIVDMCNCNNTCGGGDTAPTASSVAFSGTLQDGQTLSGTYTYADDDSDAETTSTFKWYASTSSGGASKTAISGATSQTFTLTASEVGKFISFEVTPKNANDTGSAVESSINSSAVIALDSTPPVVQSSETTGTPAQNATSATFRVVFDENVANISTDDFELTTTGTATGTIASVSATSGTDTIDVTLNSISGAGTLRLDVKASTDITDASGNGNNNNGYVATYTSGSTHSVDTVAPTVSSVSVPNNATYIATQTLSFTVNTSENVTVTGTPRLTLTIGGTTKYATYASGGGTSALVFTYTVEIGLLDSDGIAVGAAIDLNSGTLKDSATNDMTLALASVGATTAILVDSTVPILSSVSSSSIAGTTADIKATPNESGNMYYVITTSSSTPSATQVVDGQDENGAGAFKSGTNAVTLNTQKSFSITGLSESTQYYYYIVTVDSATNKSTVSNGTFTTTDTTAPIVSSVSVPANATYKIGASLSFTVNTSENVTVDTSGGTPSLTLDIGGVTKYATYASGTGTSALVFTYTVEESLTDSDGIAVSALELNSGTLKDGSANVMTLTLNSVADSSAVLVDAIKPTLTTVSIASNNSDTSKAKVGDTVTLTIVSSEALSGNPVVTIDGNAATESTSDSTHYTATYILQTGDTEGALTFAIDFEDVATNGGTTVTGVTDGTAVTFDETVPTLSSIVPADNATGIAVDADLVITLNEDIAKGTGDILIKKTSGNVLVETITIESSGLVSISNGALTINPNTTLDLNTEYYVQIPSGALTDIVGNDYAGITVANNWSFTTVADSTAPTISSIAIPDSAMKVGDTVTVTITVPSDADDYTTSSGAITGTIGGFTLINLSRNSNTEYTAQFTVTEGGTDVASGSNIPVSFTLTDSAGNESTAFTTAITQASDSIDANKPTLSTVTIASNNSTTTLAKVGDTVTLTFTSSETLTANPTVTIAGQTATVVSASGDDYVFSRLLESGDTEGTLFTIDFADVATNSGTQVTGVTTGSLVTFDKTVPSGYSVAISTDPIINSNKTALAFAFSGAEVGTTYNYSIDDTAGGTVAITGTGTIGTTTDSISAIDVSTLNDDTLTLTVTLTDPSGNIGSNATDTVLKDATLPTLAQVTAVPTPATDSTPTYTFNLSENGTLAVGGSCGSSDEGAVTAGDVTITLTQTDNSTALADGTYANCTIIVTDANGNPSATLNIPSFTIDTTAPTAVTFNPADSGNHPKNNNLIMTFNEAIRNIDDSEITDSNVANLITLKLTNSSGAIVDFSATIDANKQVITIDPTNDLTESQVYYLAYANVEDLVGNARVSENITFTAQPDTTAPSVTIYSPADNNTTTLIDANLTVVFDESIQIGTGNINIKYDANDTLVETFDITTSSQVIVSNNTLTINPTSNLEFATKYYVELDAGVVKDNASTPNDYAGLNVKGDWDFTTYEKLSLTNLEGANITYTEGDGNVSISSLIEVINPSDENITGTTVEISSSFVSSEDTLHFVDANGITGDFNSTNGVLSLSGDANLTHYQTALRSITYENNNSANPNTTTRVLDINITDRLATSTTVQRSIALSATNDIPTITNVSNITKSVDFSDFNISINGIDDLDKSDLNITVDTNDTTIITVSKNWDNNVSYADYFSKDLNISVASISGQTGVTELNVSVNDGTTITSEIFNISVVDNTPDAFSFTALTNQNQSTVLESETVVITGIGDGIAISITNGEYKIGDGAYTTSAGTIDNDENVTLRQTSSASYSTTTTSSVTIGDTTQGFAVTTKAAPAPPPPAPTQAPTDAPTQAPTQAPTDAPTQAPTDAPTQAPTEAPTDAPTQAPTEAPTDAPTQAPTDAPTDAPTQAPTDAPTDAPTQAPTDAPTDAPTPIYTPPPTTPVVVPVPDPEPTPDPVEPTEPEPDTIILIDDDVNEEAVVINEIETNVEIETYEEFSEDGDGESTATIEFKDEDGEVTQTEIKTDIPKEDITITSTDGGVETKATVANDDGSTTEMTLKVNSNGTVVNEVLVTDSEGKETATKISSLKAGADIEIKEDGSIITSVKNNHGTEVKAVATANGEVEHEVGVTDESGAVVKTIATSNITGSSVIIKDDGAVQTSAKITTDDTQEEVLLVAESTSDGKASHIILLKDSEGNSVITKAESEIAGAITTMTEVGVQTAVKVNDTVVKVTASVDGIAEHSVRLESGVESKATSNIKGASTIIKESGSVETKAQPKVFKIEGKTIEAIVDTLPDGTSFTRFEITDIATGEVEIRETTSDATSFEEGNEAVIEEVDGVMQLNIRTKVTRSIVF